MRGCVLFRLLFICCLGAALSVPVADAAGRRASASLSSLDLGVLAQLNIVRVEHRLAPFQANGGLNGAATQHSTEMATDGYFAHSSADGSLFWRRLLQYFPRTGTASWSVGENLFWTSGAVDPRRVVARWMASPDHRSNILNPNWREIGISSISESAAPGAFDNLDVVIITTDFGGRDSNT